MKKRIILELLLLVSFHINCNSTNEKGQVLETLVNEVTHSKIKALGNCRYSVKSLALMEGMESVEHMLDLKKVKHISTSNEINVCLDFFDNGVTITAVNWYPTTPEKDKVPYGGRTTSLCFSTQDSTALLELYLLLQESAKNCGAKFTEEYPSWIRKNN